MISESCFWRPDSHLGGLRLRKLITDDWVHVSPCLVSGGGEECGANEEKLCRQ